MADPTSFAANLLLGEGGSSRLNAQFVEKIEAEIEQVGFILKSRFYEIAAMIFVHAARESADRGTVAVVEFPKRKAS